MRHEESDFKESFFVVILSCLVGPPAQGYLGL